RLRRSTPVRRPPPPSTDAYGAAPPFVARHHPQRTPTAQHPRPSPATTLNGRLRRSTFSTGSIH
ncbi:hypothetical protein, partial [Nocardiopsis nanhaiensis]